MVLVRVVENRIEIYASNYRYVLRPDIKISIKIFIFVSLLPKLFPNAFILLIKDNDIFALERQNPVS